MDIVLLTIFILVGLYQCYKNLLLTSEIRQNMQKRWNSVVFIFIIIWLSISIDGCNRPFPEEEHEEVHGLEFVSKMNKVKSDTANSLNEVIKRKKLIAVTNSNSLNYYIYRGETMGYQYEMLKAFADHLEVTLEVKVEEDLPKSQELLYDKKVDVIARSLTSTSVRKKWFDFSDPLIITKQVIIQKLPKNWQQMQTRNEIESSLLRSTIELGGKEIHVTKGSAYVKRLQSLSNEIGDSIYIIEDERDVEELIQAVANGEIKYTVADEFLAMANKQNYPEIDYGMPVSFNQKIAWAFRIELKNELRDEMNDWLRSFGRSVEYKKIYNKYFQSIRMKYQNQKDIDSYSTRNLSTYDQVIKEVSKEIGWDWRLFSALVYEESNFKVDAQSWAGAYGIMQLMPSVMQQFGIDENSSPADHIRIGGKYLNYLDRLIPETVTDTLERAKFVLAAYNTGIGHVLDARRLAEKYDKNPNIWTDNVDFFSLNKSKPSFYNDPVVYYGYARGEETYQFVNEIFERYTKYKELVRK